MVPILKRIPLAILAISMAAIMVSFVAVSGMLPTTFMTIQSTQPPNLSDNSRILGHVTYVVRGPDGNIKSYMQSDNTRTVQGIDCAFQFLFAKQDGSQVLTTNSTLTGCGVATAGSSHFNGFNVIGLINGTGTTVTLNGTDIPTAGTYGNKCGCTGSAGSRASSNDGYINNSGIASNEGGPQPAASITGSSTTYNQITITSPTFAFSNTSGMNIRGSMLVNSTSPTAAVAFAENFLGSSPGTAVKVGTADTLTVTWTLTLS